MLAQLRERGESFSQFALRQSRVHADYFRSQPLSAADQARFEELARTSLAEQAELERTQIGDFDAFVEAYQRGLTTMLG